MASSDTEDLFESLPEQAAPERAARSLPRLRMAERRQVELRAVTLDDLVPDDHRVRLVWRFVEALDLTALHATIKAVEGQPGHPPPDPRILVALWLFATIEGIGSAREVARLCQEHIACQWLCGGVGMNAKILGDFRIAHCAVLERLLIDSFTALIQAGVASLERVAQDGVRVRAAAGAASFRRHSTLQDCRDKAAETVRRLREEADKDPAASQRRQAAARRRAAADRDRRVRDALAVAEALQAQQQECAHQEAERAATAQEDGRGDQGPQGSGEGAARLDHRRRSPDHEDGRRGFPTGVQCAVRQ
jgi:transposase